MKFRNPTIKQLQKLNIIAFVWGLLLFLGSIRVKWLVLNTDAISGLALTCLLGPIALALVGLLVLYLIVLIALNIESNSQTRIGPMRTQANMNWLLIIVTIVIVCSIPLATSLVDKNFHANIDDYFVLKIKSDFELASVLPEYDKVIYAIEEYHQDFGQYPASLSDLIPNYLPEIPPIYIRNGERLTYKLEPLYENTPPFTFTIYGHYPGLAFMHGWYLFYCPITYTGCFSEGNSYRLNEHWIWIHSPAL